MKFTKKTLLIEQVKRKIWRSYALHCTVGVFGEFVCWWSDKHLTSGQKDAKRFNTYKEAQQGTIDVYLVNQNRKRDRPFWRKTDNVWRVIEVDS